jgi:hypothetical protein
MNTPKSKPFACMECGHRMVQKTHALILQAGIAS